MGTAQPQCLALCLAALVTAAREQIKAPHTHHLSLPLLLLSFLPCKWLESSPPPLKAFNSSSLPDSSCGNHGIAGIRHKWNKWGAHLHISLLCGISSDSASIMTFCVSVEYHAMWIRLLSSTLSVSLLILKKVQCPQCVTQYSYVNLQVLFIIGMVLKWRSNEHQSHRYCIHVCVEILYPIHSSSKTCYIITACRKKQQLETN